jgi:ABC-2 type transport system permease protein
MAKLGTMPRSIAAAALRERRRGLVGWVLGALVATSFVVWAYTAVRDSEAVRNLIASFPPQLMALFGANPDLLATAGGFVQAQFFGFVAPLMLLTYAIGLGASATTAEEDDRTADLLLALPVRRERVIFEKFVALAVLLVTIVFSITAVLLVSNAAADLGLSLRGIVAANVGLFLVVLLHGCVALAVGAATGKRALAAATAAVLAVGSFLLQGFAPFNSAVRTAASLTPYDWYFRKTPLVTGFSDGHLMLVVAVGVTLAGAMLAFSRRDLQVTTPMFGGLRRRTRAENSRAAVRRSGRLLTSVYGKSLWFRRRSILAWALGLCGIAALTMLFWPTLSRSIGDFKVIIKMVPGEIFAAFGVSDPEDLLTAGGFISSRVHATVGLVLMLAFAVGMGASSIAGEERRGTLELQLATPLTRRRVLFESFAAMLTLIAVLGIALCLVMVSGNAAIGLDLSIESIAAATLGLMLTGVFFGALALSLGAATGSTGIARGVPAAVAIGGFLLNGLGAVVAGTAPLRYLSPIYWFLGDTPPLLRGFSVGSPVLLGAALIAVGVGALAFERRDLVR